MNKKPPTDIAGGLFAVDSRNTAKNLSKNYDICGNIIIGGLYIFLLSNRRLYGILFTKGLFGAMKYEMAVGEYDLVNISTGEVVGHGNDGAGNAFLRLLAAVICIALFLPAMLVIKPFLLLINLIKWIRMLVFMIREK